MLRSEDDPIDIMFYFPVAFSQVYRSGDGSPGSGIVGMRGSPWVGRKSRDNDAFFAIGCLSNFVPSSSLFLFIPNPQSAFYYLSAIQVFSLIPPPPIYWVVVSSFISFLFTIFYLIITICCFCIERLHYPSLFFLSFICAI